MDPIPAFDPTKPFDPVTPPFDPSKPFDVIKETAKTAPPAFDPSQPFDSIKQTALPAPQEDFLTRALNMGNGAAQSVLSLGGRVAASALRSVADVSEPALGELVKAPLRSAADWVDDQSEQLHVAGAAHGSTDPISITLDHLSPGSKVADIYKHVSNATATGLESFAAPENAPLLAAGGFGGRVLAGVFTWQGLKQLPVAKKAFDAAPDLNTKIDIAVPAILAVIAPALGLKGHATSPKMEAQVAAEMHNNLSAFPDAMLHTALEDPTLHPDVKAAINNVLEAKDRVGPETAEADRQVKAAPEVTPEGTPEGTPEVIPIEPHPEERMTAEGEIFPALAREVEPTPNKLTPALLNPDGSLMEAAKPGEKTHANVTQRAVNEAMDKGDFDRAQKIIQASGADEQHGFQAIGQEKPLNRAEAGALADATGQRDQAFAGRPLQSQHLELGQKGYTLTATENSTHKALGVTDKEMQEGLPTQEVMRRMVTNSMATPGQRALAAILSKFDSGATMTSERNPKVGEVVVPGVFKAGKVRIESNLFHNAARETALHEAWHAVDFWAQWKAETPAARKYAAEMKRIHEIASAHPDADKFKYELQLIENKPLEMIPGLANEKFFNFMNRVLDPRGKSLFSRILAVAQKFLGLRRGSLAHSALESVLSLKSEDITTAEKKSTKDAWAQTDPMLPSELGAKPEHEEGRQLMQDIAAHMAIEDPQRIVTKGAELILEQGIHTYKDWKAAMTKEFGEGFVATTKTWKAVQDLLQSYNEAKTGKSVRPKNQIAQATGLQDSAAIVKTNMATAISRADALGIHLAALEKGAAAGRKASEAQTRIMDRWMAADQERVRTDLMEFVNKTLPPNERGRFTGAITRALRRPDLLRGDPATMYRNAYRVMRAINSRAEIVYKTDRISEIKKAFSRYADSPTVDVTYRDKIKSLLEDVSLTKPSEKTLSKLRSLQEFVDRKTAAGEDTSVPKEILAKLDLLTKLPLKDMSLNAVDQLHERIQRLTELGKLKADLLERQWESEKKASLKEMTTGKGQDVTSKRAVKAQPGEKLTGIQVAINMKNAAQNAVTQAELFISPTDMVGDMMDGSHGDYNRWWSRNIKGKLDLAHNAKEAMLSKIKTESRTIAVQHKLTRQNFERIGIKGIINMIGRERLEAMGIDPKILDTIEKQNLSAGEQAYYDYTRKIYDDFGLKIKDLAHRLYQMDVEIVDKYVPLMRDWAAHAEREPIKPGDDPTKSEIPFDEKATLRQLQEDTNSQRRTEQGFLQARLKGAKTAVKYNAQEVFERHANDALHFLNAQPVLKMLGEIVATPEFKAKYGDIGQKFTHDLLDTVATQGQVGSAHRIRALDWVRNSTSKGAIAFRLASNLVHMSQIPLAAYHTGGAGWWVKGLNLVLSKEGQAFLRANAAETFVRSGGEPSQADVEAIGRISKAGFIVARTIDRFNAQATFLGRYTKELAAKGVDLDNVLSHPVDPEVQALALRRMRRAVASPLGKDVPQLISRGKGIGGNVSVARSLTQFKNIFLDIWSNVRHDLIRVGAQNMHDVIEAMRQGEVQHGVKVLGDAATHRAAVAAALLMGVALETGVKHYVKKGIQGSVEAITGAPPTPSKKDNETDAQQLQDEFIHHVAMRVPLLGNLLSMYDYSETGVPVADAIVKPVIELGKLAASKTPKTKTAHAVRAVGGAATVAGLPGVSQAAEIAEPIITKNLRGGRVKAGLGGGL